MIYWPPLLAPLSVAVDVLNRSVAGTPSLSGLSQHVVSSAGVWAITYTGVGLTGPARIKTWRAIQALAEGRVNRIVVPIRERSYLKPATRSHAPHEDDAPHDDGADYAGDVDAVVAADAPRGATTLRIATAVAALVDAGQHCSVRDRLYRIKTVDDVTAGVATVRVWPPLREAVTAGAVVALVSPTCTVRLASDGEMDHALSALQSAAPTVRFIEDPT